jgi:hypothetical protein
MVRGRSRWGEPPKGPSLKFRVLKTSFAGNRIHCPFLIMSTNYPHWNSTFCLAGWIYPLFKAAKFC